MKNHIIVGYGKWAKKVITFLIKYKIVKKLVVITSKKKFLLYPTYKNLKEYEYKEYFKNCETAHICSSDVTHLNFFNLFSKNHLKFIVEKPLVVNRNEFNELILSKRNKYLVNYVDLYNSELNKIIKLLNKSKNKEKNLKIIYSDSSHKYKKKNKLIYNWLDHPLAITLFLNKKFSEFTINNYVSKKNKGIFKEYIDIRYKYKKTKITFVITNNFKRKRMILLKTQNSKYQFNLSKKKPIKDTSFYRLYNNLRNIEKSKFRFNSNFHKKIINEKEKILNYIKK